MSPRRIITLDLADSVRALQGVALLASCPEGDLQDVARWSHVLVFDDAEVIVPEGEHGLGFYIILAGTCRVERDGHVLDRLERGGFFGEIALLRRSPRSASVIAEGATTVLGILRSYFQPMLDRNPRLARAIRSEGERRAAALG